MNDSPRARPSSSGTWVRARRAYVDLLGDDDPAAAVLADGAVDLRLGHDRGEDDSSLRRLVSAPDDLAEVREIVESVIGVGAWPTAGPAPGEVTRARVELSGPTAVLGLLLSMDGLIERRSPWGRWRTVVDIMAARVAELDAVTASFVVVEPAA